MIKRNAEKIKFGIYVVVAVAVETCDDEETSVSYHKEK